MNKKHFATISLLAALVILTMFISTKIVPDQKVSYKNKSYSGEDENWIVSFNVRDKQVDFKITPKNSMDKDSTIQCKFKTGPQYSSSSSIGYGESQKSFYATTGLIVEPINYKNEIFSITYNNKVSNITLKPIDKH